MLLFWSPHHQFNLSSYLQIFTDRMCWKEWKRCVESEHSMEELEVYSSVLLDRSGFLESQMRLFVKFYAWETYQLHDVFLSLWTVLPGCVFFKQNLQGMWKSHLLDLLRFGFVVFKRGSFGSSNSDHLGVAAEPVSSGHGVEVKVMLGAAGPETEAVEWCQCKASESWYQDIIVIMLLFFSKLIYVQS